MTPLSSRSSSITCLTDNTPITKESLNGIKLSLSDQSLDKTLTDMEQTSTNQDNTLTEQFDNITTHSIQSIILHSDTVNELTNNTTIQCPGLLYLPKGLLSTEIITTDPCTCTLETSLSPVLQSTSPLQDNCESDDHPPSDRQLTLSTHTDNDVTGQYSKQYSMTNTTLTDITRQHCTIHPLQYKWYYITIPCYTVTIH